SHGAHMERRIAVLGFLRPDTSPEKAILGVTFLVPGLAVLLLGLQGFDLLARAPSAVAVHDALRRFAVRFHAGAPSRSGVRLRRSKTWPSSAATSRSSARWAFHSERCESRMSSGVYTVVDGLWSRLRPWNV